jgi:hypothetical protein
MENRLLIRVVFGISLTVFAGYFTAFPSPPVRFPVLVAMTAFLAGSLMGTWWSVILVPLALFAGSYVWQLIHCANCPIGDRMPIEYQLMATTAVFLVISLVTATGTLVSKALGAMRNR